MNDAQQAIKLRHAVDIAEAQACPSDYGPVATIARRVEVSHAEAVELCPRCGGGIEERRHRIDQRASKAQRLGHSKRNRRGTEGPVWLRRVACARGCWEQRWRERGE